MDQFYSDMVKLTADTLATKKEQERLEQILFDRDVSLIVEYICKDAKSTIKQQASEGKTTACIFSHAYSMYFVVSVKGTVTYAKDTSGGDTASYSFGFLRKTQLFKDLITKKLKPFVVDFKCLSIEVQWKLV